jgi:hypothetical protein
VLTGKNIFGVEHCGLASADQKAAHSMLLAVTIFRESRQARRSTVENPQIGVTFLTKH